MKRKIISWGLSLLLPGLMVAQQLDVTVTLDASHLEDRPREALSQLARNIQLYIQRSSWLKLDKRARFTIQCQIFVDSYTEAGYQHVYTARAYWSNGDDQRYFDKKWQFAYVPGQQLVHSALFQSLTGFIDYWVEILLAGELDTWTQFGGSDLYARAHAVALQGTQSSLSLGWDQRLRTVEQLSQDQAFRKMRFAYYEALYRWDEQQDEEAHRQIEAFLENYATVLERSENKVYAQQFMEAKYRELGELLQDMDDAESVGRLVELDNAHSEYYRKLLRNWQ